MTSESVESAWANIGFFLYQLDPEVRRLESLPLKILKKKQYASLDNCYIVFYGFINEIIKLDLRKSINETKHTSL